MFKVGYLQAFNQNLEVLVDSSPHAMDEDDDTISPKRENSTAGIKTSSNRSHPSNAIVGRSTLSSASLRPNTPANKKIAANVKEFPKDYVISSRHKSAVFHT
jgi:hypothetical protein